MMQYTPAQIAAFVKSFYPRTLRLVLVPYAYPVTFTAFAQNATQTQNISIQANADFLHLSTSYHAHIAAAQTVSTKTVAFARMQIVDNGSGEQFYASAVDLEAICNNDAQQSGIVQFPRLIAGRSSLTMTLTGYQPTAETYGVVNVTLEGINVKAMK